mmetsp:Transcript_32443/g.95621  ORF Transcript_32443/g.95621 Transcript_32443/m.95621 type:complete len:296 (+) Transcript_32443:937-1824(+)
MLFRRPLTKKRRTRWSLPSLPIGLRLPLRRRPLRWRGRSDHRRSDHRSSRHVRQGRRRTKILPGGQYNARVRHKAARRCRLLEGNLQDDQANLLRLVQDQRLRGLPVSLANVLRGLDASPLHLAMLRNSHSSSEDQEEPVRRLGPALLLVTRIAVRWPRTSPRRTSGARLWVLFSRPRQSSRPQQPMHKLIQVKRLLTRLILLGRQEHRELAEYAERRVSEIQLARAFCRRRQRRPLLRTKVASQLLEQVREIGLDLPEGWPEPSLPRGSSLSERSTSKRSSIPMPIKTTSMLIT